MSQDINQADDIPQKIIVKAPKKLLPFAITQVLSNHKMLCNKDLGHLYTQPIIDYQEENNFKPQVQLVFLPIKHKATEGSTNINYHSRTTTSYRLVQYTAKTITNDELNQISTRIKETFGIEGGILWFKGHDEYTYKDKEKGYNFRLLCNSQSQAKTIIEKVMTLNSHEPDWKKLYITTNAEPNLTFPTIPPKEEILGKQIQQPNYRPTVVVKFTHALVHIHDLKKPVQLI